MKKIYAVALILLMGCGGESDPEPVEEKLNYTITVSAGEGGSVDTLGGTYPEGTALTITATPEAEYLFDGWSGTEISTSNPLTVILTGNESVVANFVKKQYNIALSIEGEGTVEEVVTKAGKEYASGTEVELTAIPAEGWMFNGWTGDLETIDNPVSITIDEAKSVTANFIRKTYELTVNIEGEGTVDEQVVVAPSQYEFETQVELTANPAEGWEFSNWSGAVEGTDNPVTIEITDAKEVTAVFTRKIYDLNVSIEGEGTVAEEVVVAPSQYEFETELRLTAEPSQYWQFVGWSGDIESTDNPITFTIDKAYNLDATFEFIDTDGDGVTDELDQCPDTPSNTSVNEEGCAFLFIADNGVTIKASDFSQTGETYQLNGESYLVVDRTTLLSMARDHENQDLSKVVTSKVSDLSSLFYNEKTFNQDISSWDVSNVTNMAYTFTYAESFNQDLNNWDTSLLENLNSTFWYARAFSQNLNNWDVSKVTTMLSLFDKSGFNGDVSSWDTSSVTNMFAVFAYTPFDGDISQWNTSSVTNMHSMFEEATKFNQSIGQWDVSKVESFRDMFNRAFLFDQDISEWDVTAASDMIRMFQNADDFNQDLSNWCVSQFNEEPENFDLSADLWTKARPVWGTCPGDYSVINENFNDCNLNNFTYNGGSISSTSNGFEGCGVYMTHYAGEQANNFYLTNVKSGYGTYEVMANANNYISDAIVRLFDDETIGGSDAMTFSFRPSGTDNPGWSINVGDFNYNENSFSIQRNQWFKIKIEISPTSLVIYINDSELKRFDDYTFSLPSSEGYFKLGASYSSYFDNISYTPL